MEIRGWGTIPDPAPGDYCLTLSRVSTGRERQLSVPGQQAAARRGLDLVGFAGLPVPEDGNYVEEAGRLDWAKRTQTHLLLTRIRDPHCRAVGIWRSDRLIGGASQTEEIYETLAAFDVLLVENETHPRVLNPRTSGEEMAAVFEGSRARSDVVETRKKMYSSNKEKFLLGKHVSSSPYGTRRVPVKDERGEPVIVRGRAVRELAVHPEEYPWVQKFYEWTVAGREFQWIQDEMNRLGVPTRNGVRWSKQGIRRIVGNPFYKGVMVWGKRKRVHFGGTSERRVLPEEQRFENDSPLGPLIDPDLWEEANQVIARRWHVRGGGRGHRTNDPRVLDGLVYCARCGGRMFTRQQRYKLAGSEEYVGGAFSYHCNGTNSIYSSCRGTYHSMSEIRILAALENYADQAGGLVGGRVVSVPLVRAGRDEAAEVRLRKVLARIAAKLEREKDLYSDGDRTKAEYEQRKATLLAERTAAQVEVAELAKPRRERVYGPEAQEATAALATLVPLLRDERISHVIRQREARFSISRILIDQPGPVVVEFVQDAG
jgi:hypothetical protein